MTVLGDGATTLFSIPMVDLTVEAGIRFDECIAVWDRPKWFNEGLAHSMKQRVVQIARGSPQICLVSCVGFRDPRTRHEQELVTQPRWGQGRHLP